MEQISNELNSIYELILKGKSLNETKTNKSNEFMKSMSNLKKEDLFTQSKKWAQKIYNHSAGILF